MTRAGSRPRCRVESRIPRYVLTVTEDRSAERVELLLDAARQLGETLEPERVYDRFRELLAGVVQHDGVVVSAYDESDGLIRCEYAWVGGNRLDPAICRRCR